MANEGGDKPILLGASEGEEVSSLRRPKAKEDAAAGKELSNLLARRRALIQEQDTFESVTCTSKREETSKEAERQPTESKEAEQQPTEKAAETEKVTAESPQKKEEDDKDDKEVQPQPEEEKKHEEVDGNDDDEVKEKDHVIEEPQEEQMQDEVAEPQDCQQQQQQQQQQQEEEEQPQQEEDDVSKSLPSNEEPASDSQREVEKNEEVPPAQAENGEEKDISQESQEALQEMMPAAPALEEAPQQGSSEDLPVDPVQVLVAVEEVTSTEPASAETVAEEATPTETTPVEAAAAPTLEEAAEELTQPAEAPSATAETTTEAIAPTSESPDPMPACSFEIAINDCKKKADEASAAPEATKDQSSPPETEPSPPAKVGIIEMSPPKKVVKPRREPAKPTEQKEERVVAAASVEAAPAPTTSVTPPAPTAASTCTATAAAPPTAPESAPASSETTVVPPPPAAAAAATAAAPPAAAAAVPAFNAAAPAAATSAAPLGALSEAGPVPAEAAEEDYSNEPLETRLTSKDLERRCSAWSELCAKMAEPTDEPSEREQCFVLMKKHIDTCLAETLPKGQGCALTALGAYLEHATDIDASEVLPLVRRLVEHKSIDKPKMQQLVPTVISLVAEIVECPAVVAELTACLTDLENAKKKIQGFFKKQVAVIIKLLSHLLRDFGPLKMVPKLGYVNLAVKYLSDTDRGIKESCYSVLVELSCWLGEEPDATKTLEEPQKKELSKRFDALSDEEKARSQPPRRYRGEKVVDDDKAGMAVDKYALAEAVDVLKKLPKGWTFEKVFGMEKWKDKQVHLQELYTLLDSATKLAPSEGYAALVPGLTRLIKTESNLPVLTEGAKVMGLLALKLRKDFERPARQLLPITLARMNDKSVWKPNILIERVEQLLWSLPFEFLLQELQTYLESKSLFVKKEAMHLLLRTLELPAVKAVHPEAAKQFFEALATPVVSLIDDSDNGVRHEAAKYLTVLVRANLDNPEVGTIVLDRIPPHRASAFEEEWKKAVPDTPCPLKSRSTTQSTSVKSASCEAGPVSAPSNRSSSNLKSRPESSDDNNNSNANNGARNGGRAVSPLRGLTPRGSRLGSPLRPRTTTSKIGDSPSKPHGASPSRRPASPGGPSTQARIRNASSDKAASEKTELPQEALANIEKMAQEIRSLRSTVAQLQQRDKDQIPPAPQTPRGAVELRRPATPPKRPQSWDGSPAPRTNQPTVLPSANFNSNTNSNNSSSFITAPGATTPRRGSLGASSTAAPAPSPAKKAMSPKPGQGQIREPTRPVFTRSNSADLLRKRAGRQDQMQPVPGLTRQGSHSTLATAAAAGRAPPTLEFAVYEPRMPKAQRQDRERCQYWGPDKIPAEYLSALKDTWKQSVGLQLTKLMFSDKLEEQLVALQSWKMKATEEQSNVDLVLDMLLKWLTWMLFNANTQVWRGVTEVLSLTLRSLDQAQLTLTEREAQILLPNLLERSGHNIASVREGMEGIIRQTVGLHPKQKLLPMLLLGLHSKSKRSAACAMRGLGDAMDKTMVAALSRSQKDMTALLKTLDDKDADLRKAAVQTVASMSQHMDAPAFARITRSLPPATQQVLRSAAAKMIPMPANTYSMSAGESAIPNPPLSARLTRNRSGSALVLQPPNTARGTAPQQEEASTSTAPQPRPQRLSQPSNPTARETDRAPRRDSGADICESREQSQPQEPPRRPRRSSVGSTLAETVPSSPAPGPSPLTGGANSASASEEVNSIVREVALTTAPIGQLSDRLLRCGSNQDFSILAETLKARMKQVKEAEAPGLADALVESMRVYLGHDRHASRCKPLVDVLEEFCSSRDCLQPLPSSMLRGLLREQLKHLHHSKWTTQIEGGAALLRSINLSCVMLLNHLPRSLALSLLLQLGTEESEIIASSLVVKCLRKVTKGLANHRDVQGESGAILDALSTWLRRAQPRLSSLLGCLRETNHGVTPRSLVDAAVCTLLEGVREVVDLVQGLVPTVASEWSSTLRSEERKLLEACHKPVGLVDAEGQDKENIPVSSVVGKQGDTNSAAAPGLSVTRSTVA